MADTITIHLEKNAKDTFDTIVGYLSNDNFETLEYTFLSMKAALCLLPLKK